MASPLFTFFQKKPMPLPSRKVEKAVLATEKEPLGFVRRVLHFPDNRLGRDFVVGDLHGCLEPLGRLMETVNFHTGRDRLFSVGDLVDRGPFSMACLKLLRMPWFHAVRGNHEQFLINHLQNPQRIRAYDEHWLKQVAPRFSDRNKLAGEWLPLLRSLPLVMVVGEGSGRFQVVHGELLEEGEPVTNRMIDEWDFHDPETVERRALSGRVLFKTHINGGQVNRAHHPEKMSPTYCGHTIVEAPLKLAGQIYLDRGAFQGLRSLDHRLDPAKEEAPVGEVRAGLVMVEHSTGQAWISPTDPPGKPIPVFIKQIEAL